MANAWSSGGEHGSGGWNHRPWSETDFGEREVGSFRGTEPQDGTSSRVQEPKFQNPTESSPDSQQIPVKSAGVVEDTGQQAVLCPLVLHSVAPLCTRTVLGTWSRQTGWSQCSLNL